MKPEAHPASNGTGANVFEGCAANLPPHSGPFLDVLRVACVQIDPAISGKAKENAKLVEELLLQAGIDHPGQVDLLVLPEMGLTGYIFQDEKDIQDVLESVRASRDAGEDETETCPTLHLAQKLASSLQCYVLAGFPENAHHASPRVAIDRSPISSSSLCIPPCDSRTHDLIPTDRKRTDLYNSAVLADRTGNLIHVFRKHFLFDDDKRWAEESPGFEYVNLPDLGRLAVGICMDLNPYEFKAPFEAFELSRFAAQHRADILAVPMNWLLPTEEIEPELQVSASANSHANPLLPSVSTINYWAWRCAPLCEPNGEGAVGHQTVVIAANRCGKEKGKTFAGSSSIFAMENGQQPELLGFLGRRQEGVLVRKVYRKRQ
ncbi:carbon-nitrogen hydrolase [Tilletiaria anomala UBC 951]|uniref:Carbon-nitrogen hydrolase n=1 Tax=Tilletiaria anomala (strain ATCC 24038 / CBS 436.72 / UBC 951) TaxID=1037660 RepID=A0A066V2H5_TILAU|nr:carbon-nitrogen hydrolase [Tilletiaria anomala UBC 951]KDN35892.1 carbon-nitrogen hydrolase [Tilletiaria anomala UBC 951]